jgi:XTP/dITP diphosphohydrolase
MTQSASPSAILVIATNNVGKLSEIRQLLAAHPIEVCRPRDLLGHALDVVEDGDSFEANAALKARAVAAATGHLTLADDSGLEVDALGGLPGVRSARFAGEQASDGDNNRELLQRLGAVSAARPTARFRCAMALFDPTRQTTEFTSGACEGWITRQPRGTHGFGYDPLFVVEGEGDRTMAELDDMQKNVISHRGRALRAMLPKILQALAV